MRVIIVFEQNLKALVSWCTAGTPRDDSSISSTVLLGDSPRRDQGSPVEGTTQMWAQAEGPHARCHWLAAKQD